MNLWQIRNEAYELFMKGNLVDLENWRGNTPEGIHTACCGAVWQAVIFGFAGLRVTEDGRLHPRAPCPLRGHAWPFPSFTRARGNRSISAGGEPMRHGEHLPDNQQVPDRCSFGNGKDGVV